MGRIAQPPPQLDDDDLRTAVAMLRQKRSLTDIAAAMTPRLSRQGLRIALALHGFDQGYYLLPTTPEAEKRLRALEAALASTSDNAPAADL